MLSPEKRAEINRRNAQKSTGPKTKAGKDQVRLNATRHNLTGQTVVRFTQDMEAFDKFQKTFFDHHQPVGPVETQLVVSVAQSSWKMNECSAWEANILAGKSVEHLHKYPEANNPQANEALATGETVLNITKDLANLSLYAHRHFRTLERSLDRLANLQTERKASEAVARMHAEALLKLHEQEELDKQEAREKAADIAVRTGQPSPEPYLPQPYPSDLPNQTKDGQLISQRPTAEPVIRVNGFVFSIVDIKAHMLHQERLNQALKLRQANAQAA